VGRNGDEGKDGEEGQTAGGCEGLKPENIKTSFSCSDRSLKNLYCVCLYAIEKESTAVAVQGG